MTEHGVQVCFYIHEMHYTVNAGLEITYLGGYYQM